jgi:hypothetical protein
MAFKEFYLQPKWFDEATPTNPKKASATLTISDDVSNGETITIGTDVFEFRTAGSAGTGNIKVDISGAGDTASDKAAAKLVAAINANSTLVDAVASKDDDKNDIVVVTYKTVGTEGNSVAVAETMTDGSWGTGVTKLSGGQWGTPCPVVDTIVHVDSYYYWCDIAGNKDDVSWKIFTPASY